MAPFRLFPFIPLCLKGVEYQILQPFRAAEDDDDAIRDLFLMQVTGIRQCCFREV